MYIQHIHTNESVFPLEARALVASIHVHRLRVSAYVYKAIHHSKQQHSHSLATHLWGGRQADCVQASLRWQSGAKHVRFYARLLYRMSESMGDKAQQITWNMHFSCLKLVSFDSRIGLFWLMDWSLLTH